MSAMSSRISPAQGSAWARRRNHAAIASVMQTILGWASRSRRQSVVAALAWSGSSRNELCSRRVDSSVGRRRKSSGSVYGKLSTSRGPSSKSATESPIASMWAWSRSGVTDNGAYLAMAGLDVLILEQNEYLGGATASRKGPDS